MDKSGSSVQRLEELDGFRGVLAFYVATVHLLSQMTLTADLLKSYFPILSRAWYAVDIFFLMSGFVMAYVYGRNAATGMTIKGALSFLQARIARIYPVHLLMLFVFIGLTLVAYHNRPEMFVSSGTYSLTALVAAIFLLHSPWIDHLTWNHPSWSISAEFHAYLLFPFLMPLSARLKTVGHFLVIIAGVVIPMSVYFAMGHDTFLTNTPVVLLRVLPLFLAGMSVCAIYRQYSAILQKTSVALVAIAGTCICLSWPPIAPLSLVFAPLLLACVLTTPFLKGFLSSPIPVHLGKLSYSLYMIHFVIEVVLMPLMIKLLYRFTHLDATRNIAVSLVLLVVGLAISLGISQLVYSYFEKPARGWVARIGKPRTAAKVAPQSAPAD